MNFGTRDVPGRRQYGDCVPGSASSNILAHTRNAEGTAPFPTIPQEIWLTFKKASPIQICCNHIHGLGGVTTDNAEQTTKLFCDKNCKLRARASVDEC